MFSVQHVAVVLTRRVKRSPSSSGVTRPEPASRYLITRRREDRNANAAPARITEARRVAGVTVNRDQWRRRGELRQRLASAQTVLTQSVTSAAARSRVLPRDGGHRATVAEIGVMQPSAIGAGDDCCDRGRSRCSRALWRRAARLAAPGAHDGSATGCDSRADGVAVTVGGPESWSSVRRTAADRRPRARGVAPPRRTQWQKRRGDLRRSRSQAVKRQPAFVCQRH